MMRDALHLFIRAGAELRLKRLSHSAVQHDPLLMQQRFVGDLAHQGMAEAEGGARRPRLPVDEAELAQCLKLGRDARDGSAQHAGQNSQWRASIHQSTV